MHPTPAEMSRRAQVEMGDLVFTRCVAGSAVGYEAGVAEAWTFPSTGFGRNVSGPSLSSETRA